MQHLFYCPFIATNGQNPMAPNPNTMPVKPIVIAFVLPNISFSPSNPKVYTYALPYTPANSREVDDLLRFL